MARDPRRTVLARWLARARALLVVCAGAVALRALLGVGFANYDTLYALVWGQQLARGEAPQYALPIAPTPHPLVEALGVVLAPLGPHAASRAIVWLGYVALAACGYLAYRLGSAWFNRPVGTLAALVLLTRTPILSYGSRAYIDLPFLALVLGAMLVESRRPRAGAPVLALLALAGLLRPEAWLFSGLYWLYLASHGRIAWDSAKRRPARAVPAVPRAGAFANARRADGARASASRAYDAPLSASRASGGRATHAAVPGQTRGAAELASLALLALAAPIAWVASDLAASGNALWSLTHTRQTASTLDRVTGIANVPEYVPRRIGAIVRPAGLVGAALGAACALAWLPRRALMGVVVGVAAVLVFALLASFGLPIDERYAFLAASIVCIFCAVGALGWLSLPVGAGRRRLVWALAGALVIVALIASSPGQYRSVHTQLRNLTRQQRAEDALVALVRGRAITTRCGPVGVPNHAPIPLLALWLEAKPGRVVSAKVRPVTRGTYVEATNVAARELLLGPHEPGALAPVVPAGFAPVGGNRAWRVYERCG